VTIHFERVIGPHYGGSKRHGRGHWFLRDKPEGQWIPEAVGIVHAYPPTLEAWERRQRVGLTHFQRGNPGRITGWKGTRQELLRLRAEARVRAAAKMEKIRMAIKFEDERAEKAMEAMVEVVELKDANGKRLHGVKDLAMASRLILEYTQPKPVTKNEHVIKAAEDWLESLD
jgi:hypothetical protein